MFVPLHFLAYIPFNVLLPGESNPGHTAYAVGIPQSSESIIHTRLYLLLPVISPPRSVAILKATSSTLPGVTTPHQSFPPPALRSYLRFAAFSKRSPSGGRPPSGIQWRTTSFCPHLKKPESLPAVFSAPAALFSQPLRQTPSNILNASVAISNFHATYPDTPRSPSSSLLF